MEDMDNILAAAKRNNAQMGVSGALFFNGVRFLQILEGARADVESIVTRVSADTRHVAMEVISVEDVDRRAFPDWTMNLFYLPPFNSVVDDWSERLEHYFNALPPTVPADLREFIRNFDNQGLHKLAG